MFNPDGTEDMCGNGLRCVALWAHRAGWADASCFTIATKEGPRQVEILGLDGPQGQVRVDMGVPRSAPADIPFLGPPSPAGLDDWCLTSLSPSAGAGLYIAAVNTGSTHTVIFGEAPSEEEFRSVSPLIETHPLFPERTSVLVGDADGPKQYQRAYLGARGGRDMGVWHGGVCGRCSARLLALVSDGPVDMASRGGTLRIDWPGAGHQIRMTGPAQVVFEGEIEIDAAR